MQKYGFSVRELTSLTKWALNTGIVDEVQLSRKGGDRCSTSSSKDSRRFSRTKLDFALVARSILRPGTKGRITDMCEGGFQVVGMPATAGKSVEIELLMDWRSNEPQLFLEAGCRWTELGGKFPGVKAGFEVIDVRRGDFSQLLEDISPLSLSNFAASDLNVSCEAGISRIDTDYLRNLRSKGETTGWEEKISRVRFLKILDILSVPCLLIDGKGLIIHVSTYSSTISPDIFRVIGKPFASIFLDRDLPARVRKVSGSLSSLQATLRIQEKLVPCRIESRTLGAPTGAHLLVFLKPWASSPMDSLPQIGDVRTLCDIKPTSCSPYATPVYVDGPFTSRISETLNGDRLETILESEFCSTPETWAPEIDPEIAGNGERFSQFTCPSILLYGTDRSGDTEDPTALTDEGRAVSCLGGCGSSLSSDELEAPSGAETRGQPQSQIMREVLEQCRVVAKTDTLVLLHGESGSGKDYLAQFIHGHSSRSIGPFRSVNCAAIPEQLAETEFFGHEEGAFTGAHIPKDGVLESAPGGTLLLNEIGELPLVLQAKLLTFLDTGRFFRVGGQSEVSMDSRILAATNKDLKQDVRAGSFRADLFYRLNVVPIRVPPLRERIEDLPLLIEDLTADLVRRLRLNTVPTIDPKTMSSLRAYHWPGNVRELKNRLERSLGLSKGKTISLALMFNHNGHEQWEFNFRFPVGGDFNQFKGEVLRRLVAEALVRADGKRQKAAKLLGITRYALKRHMTNLGLLGNEND